MNEKPDCYKCKFMRPVPGDAHIQCRHPAFAEAYNDPESFLIMSLGGRSSKIDKCYKNCRVVGKAQGIKMGWFNHPFNFDPVWLVECSGFQKKGTKC